MRTIDPFIETVAANNRTLGQTVLGWRLDALRLHAGTVRVAEDDEKPDRMFHCTRQCAPYAHFHPIIEVTWEFECADPEVGIFGDSAYHTCRGNIEDPQPAEETDVIRRDDPEHGLVHETTTLTCPVCRARTSTTDTIPRWMFES